MLVPVPLFRRGGQALLLLFAQKLLVAGERGVLQALRVCVCVCVCVCVGGEVKWRSEERERGEQRAHWPVAERRTFLRT